ncbi:TIGR04282 family arsenosugar biosynthesis glycosyltransferase [Conexibacter woesei]|uniref:TIGR04282 family arsenosugar biosynthesis glycosyltransferase n=1 Tax=Conexibacter woesei TaxID=191495 RepID=UPI00040618AE|nr:TIGR04282 family arsenosugar biosynthesis glycosyltransferase [Conexibacter woesei]
MNGAPALIVLAKAPVAGRVKTRLCPPCTPAEAAQLAAAALADTLAAVAATPGVTRRLLVLDGVAGPWVPPGFAVLPQRGGGLDERLACAFADVGGPALLVGMDTPQVTPALLRDGLDRLARTGAVLGLAPDGGYWAIGLQRASAALFHGVPMSATDTGGAQLRRLHDQGLQVDLLPELRDVDTIADAHAVAAACPPGAAFPAALDRTLITA